MILSPIRGRTRWRHGQDCSNDTTRRQEEESDIYFARSSLLEGALCRNSKQELTDGNPVLSRLEKKLKDTLDDKIKLAGLEALVPEEQEKHLILNSSRLRTFDDARFKLVTFVDAMFGLRIRDSKPNETRAPGHCDPMDVDAINSIASATGKGKGSSNPRDGCFKNGGAHVQSDCNARHTSQRQWR